MNGYSLRDHSQIYVEVTLMVLLLRSRSHRLRRISKKGGVVLLNIQLLIVRIVKKKDFLLQMCFFT